jgi:hypothetical protein
MMMNERPELEKLFGVRLDERLHRALKVEAAKRSTTMSAIIRKALRKNKMETIVNKHIKVTLKLTEPEAIWLKGLMQNPLHGLNVEEENELNREMRKRFFVALREV